MADNKQIFDLLLSQPNADVNVKTVDEHSPLYYALLKYEAGDDSDDSYVSCLLKKGVQTSPVYSKNLENLLQFLISNGIKKAAEYLTERVQNLNHVNVNGESILHTACIKNCPEIVQSLLKLGANPNLLTNDSRQCPLHYAVLSNSAECIERFIEHNENSDEVNFVVNFNSRDVDGETPLSLALNEGYNDLVPVLIRGKADVNVRNGKDFTLLHQAILKEDAKTAIFLLDNGADMNAK